jgi:hypothetical protein
MNQAIFHSLDRSQFRLAAVSMEFKNAADTAHGV